MYHICLSLCTGDNNLLCSYTVISVIIGIGILTLEFCSGGIGMCNWCANGIGIDIMIIE